MVSLHEFALAIQSVYSPFQTDEFIKSIFDSTWDGLELKGRIRQISINLGKYLPADFQAALTVIDKVILNYGGIGKFCFPDFIEVYGQDDINWDLSINALARYTPYASSEFAVRPFIIKQEAAMMTQTYAWSRDENEHLRRLASESSLPQLPWGQALSKFKKEREEALR